MVMFTLIDRCAYLSRMPFSAYTSFSVPKIIKQLWQTFPMRFRSTTYNTQQTPRMLNIQHIIYRTYTSYIKHISRTFINIYHVYQRYTMYTVYTQHTPLILNIYHVCYWYGQLVGHQPCVCVRACVCASVRESVCPKTCRHIARRMMNG